MKRVMVAVAIFLVLTAGTALAVSPVGQWTYTGFTEPDLISSRQQGICFVAGETNSDGTASGTWYSTTFTGWQGRWYQNGERIRFYGTTGIFSSAEFGQFISSVKISGEFVFFNPKTTPVTTNSLGNFFMKWASDTCDVAAALPGSVLDGNPAIE